MQGAGGGRGDLIKGKGTYETSGSLGEYLVRGLGNVPCNALFNDLVYNGPAKGTQDVWNTRHTAMQEAVLMATCNSNIPCEVRE